MKAKDLMIGDWVNYHDDDKIVPKQVSEITNYKQLQLNDKNNWIIVGEKYCEPIPLTAEILEKNGYRFNAEVENGGDWEYYGIYKSCIYRTSSGWYLWILVGEMDGGNQISLNINYVHELQHALRLCGVEKEINL